MGETRAHAQTAHASAVANDASVETRVGELTNAARRVAVELSSGGTLSLSATQRTNVLRVRGGGTLTVGTGGAAAVLAETDSLIASAAVVPSSTEATEALIAEARELVSEFRDLLATQRQRNPRWFETPAAATAVAVLSLLVALLAFAGDRWDAAHDDQPTAPPPASAPLGIPPQNPPADSTNSGSRDDGTGTADGLISDRTTD